MGSFLVRNPRHLSRHIPYFREVYKRLAFSHPLQSLSSPSPSLTEHPYAPRLPPPLETPPNPRLQALLPKTAIDRTPTRHDRARSEIIDAIRDARRIQRRSDSILLTRAGVLQPRLRALQTVRLQHAPAQLAAEVGVVGGLDAGAVADAPVLDVRARRHDHARAFVAGRLRAEVAHCRHWQVFEHVVDV